MGSYIGVLKVAAKRVGLSYTEYISQLDAGFKHCTGCKRWLRENLFYKNKARGDSLDTHCIRCRGKDYKRSFGGKYHGRPGQQMRREKHKVGLYWCRRCGDWLPKSKMTLRRGVCLIHARIDSNEYYQRSARRRASAKAASRKRKQQDKPISVAERNKLLKEFDGICAYCQANAFEEWDHVIALANGGQSEPKNIVPACRHCNRSKHANQVDEWMEKKGFIPSAKLSKIIEELQHGNQD